MSFWSRGYDSWAPRKSAAQRRAEAARAVQDAVRRGRAKSPVVLDGRRIAQTFWGTAWCDNLERYRDFAYRLERGRSYVRSGSVIDLRIEAGKIVAEVLGSALYQVEIKIDAIERAAWRAVQRDCAGGIGSRLELLSGRLSEPVMARLCAERTGLFPTPSAIRFTCSCPDYAVMCKHVAAVMYGIGARLDRAPELLFTLRCVSLDELLTSAITELPPAPKKGRVLASDGLASLFGLELAESAARGTAATPARTRAAIPKSVVAKSIAAKSVVGRSAVAKSAIGSTKAVKAKPAKAGPAKAKPAKAGARKISKAGSTARRTARKSK
jgi:uncharacterized Zn finger protein